MLVAQVGGAGAGRPGGEVGGTAVGNNQEVVGNIDEHRETVEVNLEDLSEGGKISVTVVGL